MVVAGVDPHGLSFAGAFEAKLFVEVDGLAIRSEHVHVKICVALSHAGHDLSTDSLTLELG